MSMHFEVILRYLEASHFVWTALFTELLWSASLHRCKVWCRYEREQEEEEEKKKKEEEEKEKGEEDLCQLCAAKHQR